MHYTVQVLPLIMASGILLSLAVYEMVIQRTTAAVSFSLLMLLCLAWELCYAMEIIEADIAAKIFWLKLRFVPLSAIPVVLLMVAFQYADREEWINPGRMLVFSLEPAVAIAISFLSGDSPLFPHNFRLDPYGPAVLVNLGILAPIHVLYLFGLMFAAVFLIAGSMRDRHALFKRQSILCIFAIALPVLSEILYLLKLVTWFGVNPAAIAIPISAILLAIALFRFRFLDVVPIAAGLVIQTMSDLLIVLDSKLRLVDFNPRARTVIGFDPNKVLGHGAEALPAPWSTAVSQVSGALALRDTVSVSSPDGKHVYDASASPIRDHLGRARGRLVILHDVTELRLAEDEVAMGRERLQLAFDYASDGMWDWEIPTGHMYWSPRFYTILGYKPGEIPASFEAWKGLIHGEDLPSTLEQLDDYRRLPGDAHFLEIRMRSREGGWRWVLVKGRVVKSDAQGNPVRVVGTNVDITGRREMEERIRDSEQKFRSIIEQTIEAITLIDEQGSIIEFNPAAEKLAGLSRSEALGTRIWDLAGRLTTRSRDTTALFSAAVRERYLVALSTGQSDLLNRISESKVRRLDGTVRDVEHYQFPIRTKSGWRIGCLSRDVTEARQAQIALEKSREQLQHSQKMEAVGRLAGGIAHDFNNLLTVIRGYSDLILTQLTADGELREDMGEIVKAADRAATLTSQLLAFSRKQVLQPRVVNLNALVNNMGNMLRRVIGEDIDLTMLLPKEAGNIMADPGQIEQVLMNLAVNARDAMPAGGRLTIETCNRLLDDIYAREHPGVKAGDYVRLAVSDSGRGMDEQTLSRIFEPFFTTKEPGKGTGLGLPMAYGIVKQSGGHIFCYSEQGKGTTFTLYFPRVFTDTVSRSAPADQKAAMTYGDERILLVEDDASVRGFTAAVLKKSGYDVIEASSGLEALQQLRGPDNDIRLLVTDVVMPHMSGSELARRATQECPGVRVLYVSGYTENAIVHHGLLEPGIDFMQKPFSSQALLTKVREILDRA